MTLSHRCGRYVYAPPVWICICFAAVLFAQATGRIGGTVADSTEAVIPGASIICRNVETGLSRTVDSNDSGIFEIPDLPIGQYELEVKKQGFQAQRTETIPLLTGQTLALKIKLQVGDMGQAVTVTWEVPLVQSESSSVQTSVTVKQMQDLPLNGRNPLQLTTLAPGTAITDVGTESGQQDNRGLTVNGLRATQNKLPVGWHNLHQSLLRFGAHHAQPRRASGGHDSILRL
jgi:hypothetical protein